MMKKISWVRENSIKLFVRIKEEYLSFWALRNTIEMSANIVYIQDINRYKDMRSRDEKGENRENILALIL